MSADIAVVRWRDLDSWAPLADVASATPWPLVGLRKVLHPINPPSYIPGPDETVRFAGVRWYGEGLFVREEREGAQIKGKCYPLQQGMLVYNRLFAWKQSFAVVTAEFDGVVVSNEFPQFQVDPDLARTRYVALVCATAKFAEIALMRSTGSTAVSRNRLREDDFLDLEIPLPSLPEQDRIITHYETAMSDSRIASRAAKARSTTAWEIFANALVDPPEEEVRAGGMVSIVRFSDLSRWDKPGGEAGLSFRHPEKRLDAIADIRLGVQVPRGNGAKQLKGGVPYLASRNVRRGHVALSDLRVMDVPKSVIDALALREGDLLFVEGSGSPSEVGRCATWHNELQKCIHQNSVVRARLYEDSEAVPAFVEAWFNSTPGNEYIREQATTTSGLYHIGASKLGGAPIPLPDLPAQEALVGALQEALSLADTDMREAVLLHAEATARLEIDVFGATAEEGEVSTVGDDLAEPEIGR